MSRTPSLSWNEDTRWDAVHHYHREKDESQNSGVFTDESSRFSFTLADKDVVDGSPPHSQPRSIAEKAYTFPAKCGHDDCANGPPTIETYALCEACKKAAPCIFRAGIATIPPVWTKTEVEDNKKAKNIMYLALRCIYPIKWPAP